MLINKLKRELQNKPYLNLDSLNNCGQINSCIVQDIHYDIDQISNVYLAQGYISDNENNKSPHMFVYINPEDYTGTKPLIIDGAINQFTDENKNKGLVNTSFGRKKDLESLLICYVSDSPYNHTYTKLQNVIN